MHFYNDRGELVEVKRALEGYERGLVPSVTTILQLFSSYGLTRWKIQNAIKACHACPPAEEEDVKDYIDRLYDIADSVGREAASFGTAIHAGIECFLKTGNFPLVYDDEREWKIFDSFQKWWESSGLSIVAVEHVFVDIGIGAAGRADLVAEKDGDKILIDFKTQVFKDGKASSYDEHVNQLAALHLLANDDTIREWWNVYISTADDCIGKIEVKKYTQEKIDKRQELFLHAVQIYKILKGYEL